MTTSERKIELPPLDVTDADFKAAWSKAMSDHEGYLSGGKLRSAYECRERQLLASLAEAFRLEEQVKTLRKALSTIRDGEYHNPCGCEDHNSVDCCVNNQYHCAECIAGAALAQTSEVAGL